MLDKARIRRLHAALNAANALDYKADMLAHYGVESSKQLSAEQADELIDSLNAQAKQKKSDAPQPVRRARSTVLTLLNSLGIYADNGDWGRVNAYLMQPRISGKLLYDHDLEELKALARKLRVILKKQKALKEEENYQAANN